MRIYVNIEDRLYTITLGQARELKKIYPEIDAGNDDWSDYLDWIEKHGKYIARCEHYAY